MDQGVELVFFGTWSLRKTYNYQSVYDRQILRHRVTRKLVGGPSWAGLPQAQMVHEAVSNQWLSLRPVVCAQSVCPQRRYCGWYCKTHSLLLPCIL